MTPSEVARTQIGKPWRHQARGPDDWDCIGLMTLCFPCVRDCADYDRNPAKGELERRVAEQFGPAIEKAGMQENDLVLMAFPRVVRHVGIVARHWLGGLSIIHTWAGGPRCVTETALDEQWMRRIKFVHRWGNA